MRISRVLLAGATVAAAAVATTAFTAGNDLEQNTVAGYGDVTVSGVTVSNIAYNPGANAAQLHSVAFTVDKDTTDMTSTMTLYKAGTPDTLVATATGAECTSTTTTITCVLAADLDLTAFDKVGLTVVSN